MRNSLPRIPSRLAPRFTCAFAIFGMCALALPTGGAALATPASAVLAVAFADAGTLKDLIGRTVTDSDGAPLGAIKSIVVGKAGAASTVIMRYVNREIAINWSDIAIENNGTDIVTHLDRNELRTMPTYRYKHGNFRGTVFHDTDL